MTKSPRKRWALWAGAAGLLLLAASPGLDHPVRLWMQACNQAGALKAWAAAAYWLGLGGVQIAAMLAWALWCRYVMDKKGFADGLLGAGAVVLSGLAAQLIKHLVGRPRPRMQAPAWELLGPVWDSDFHSFPSGHSATSFALAMILTWRRPGLAYISFGAAVFIAAGRVIGGSHYLSDVLAGAILGSLCGVALGWWADGDKRRAA